MNSTHSVTLRNQLFIVKELGFSAVLFILGYFGFTFFYPSHSVLAIEVLSGYYFCLQILPCSLIHCQYLMYNRHTVLTVNPIERIMTIQQDRAVNSFSFDDIASVRLALNGFLYRGELRGLMASDRYHYAFLQTKEGEKFVITCLLENDLRHFFTDLGLEVTRDKVIFNFVLMGRYK